MLAQEGQIFGVALGIDKVICIGVDRCDCRSGEEERHIYFAPGHDASRKADRFRWTMAGARVRTHNDHQLLVRGIRHESVKGDKSIRVCNQIVYGTQPRESRQVAEREVPLLRAVSAGKQVDPGGLERLKAGICQAADGFIQAVEVDLGASSLGRSRKAKGVLEVFVLWTG